MIKKKRMYKLFSSPLFLKLVRLFSCTEGKKKENELMSQIHVFCEIKKKLDKGKRMMWILSFVFGLELSPCVDVLNPNLAL